MVQFDNIAAWLAQEELTSNPVEVTKDPFIKICIVYNFNL